MIKPSITGARVWDEAMSKPLDAETYANQRLNLGTPWEGSWKKGHGFEPDLGKPAVRDYRGASGNATLVEL